MKIPETERKGNKMIINSRKAIDLHCRECLGFLWQEDGKEIRKTHINGEWVLDAIRDCPSKKCPVYDFRNKNIEGESKLKAIRVFCKQCIGEENGILDIRNCTCGEPNLETNTPKCAFFDFRFGRNELRSGAARQNFT